MGIKLNVHLSCDYRGIGFGGTDMPCQHEDEGIAEIIGNEVQSIELPPGWERKNYYDCSSDSDKPYMTKAFCPVHRDGR